MSGCRTADFLTYFASGGTTSLNWEGDRCESQGKGKKNQQCREKMFKGLKVEDEFKPIV